MYHLYRIALAAVTGVAALTITAAPAAAATLSLDPVLVLKQYQQTTNNPCVIGEESCNQGTFPNPTILPPGDTSYDATSPEYTVAFLNSIFTSGFVVGFDVNQASAEQTISLFEMLIDGVPVDVYSADPATAVPPTVGGGNGNGFADYVFTGFTSLLSGFNDDDIVTFHAVMPLANDGREQFFLINSGLPPQNPIPEPSTYMLMGAGLLALGTLKKRLS